MTGASCPDSYVPAPSNSPTPIPTAHTWRAFIGRMVRAAWGVGRSRSVQPANRFGRILNFEVGPEAGASPSQANAAGGRAGSGGGAAANPCYYSLH